MKETTRYGLWRKKRSAEKWKIHWKKKKGGESQLSLTPTLSVHPVLGSSFFVLYYERGLSLFSKCRKSRVFPVFNFMTTGLASPLTLQILPLKIS
jgi:hypothetical protein